MLHREFQVRQAEIQFPNWAVAVLVVIAVVFTVALSLVQYTYGNLIPALIMVEDPDAAQYDSLATSDPLLDLDNNKKPSGQTIEPEILAKPRPVTYNFRTTLAHLRARGGRYSRFRGIASAIASTIVIGHLTRLITVVFPFTHLIAPVIASAIASHFLLLWTHIVISEPSQKRWYQRFAPLRTWKKIAGPTALSMFVQQVAAFVPLILFFKINGELPKTQADWADMNCHDRSMMMLKGFGVTALSFVLWFLLAIPAKVSLTRVQASLLSQEEEPIVPFDRFFGGKVVSAIVGGSGVLSMMDAWRTFNWNSRVRLVKAYLKVAAIQIALTLFFTGAAMAVTVLALGPENLKKIAKGMKPGDDN